VDGAAIEQGVIYIAPPDQHMVIKPGHIHLTRGPHENRSRPAIDVSFRSAAVAYGSRVVGIILTGMLNDGMAGLSSVKRCGGIAMVQDPESTLYPDMPRNALRAVEADYVLPVAEMGAVLTRLAAEPAGEVVPIPGDIRAEARFAERNSGPAAGDQLSGEATMLSCPECSGPLQYLHYDNAPHYRCHTGHAYTVETLSISQSEALEQALWSALRLMEEREVVLCQLVEQEKQSGRHRAAARYEERAVEMQSHIRHVRALIEQIVATA
jgi:two-component system chemotaxis response regulator CheB